VLVPGIIGSVFLIYNPALEYWAFGRDGFTVVSRVINTPAQLVFSRAVRRLPSSPPIGVSISSG
jgi:hypothetical protein